MGTPERPERPPPTPVLEYVERQASGHFAVTTAELTTDYVPSARVRAAGFLRRWFPNALLERAQLLVTSLVRPRSRRVAARLGAEGRALLVQFGSGAHHLPDWVDVDLAGTGADLVWDLRRPLPLPDACARAVFHEHLLEHLSLSHAVASLREARRLLVPGGVLRIGVPDFGAYCRDYVDGGGFIDAIRPDRPTPLLAIAEVLYDYGHRSMWDGDTLVKLLVELGFRDVAVRGFADSRLHPAPDWELRRIETLYVEAVRGETTTPK